MNLTLASLAVGLASCLWSFYLLRWSRRVAKGGLHLVSKARADLATAEARQRHAETACEELRLALMRGSSVARWQRHDAAPHSDEWYFHVITNNGQLLLTEEQWQVARARADKLLLP